MIFMKVIQINGVSGTGSTGKICESISALLDTMNIENKILYYHGYSTFKNAYRIGKEPYYKVQALKSRFLGNYGFNSNRSTDETIRILKEEKPDIIHIHNIHGHEVNIERLFRYLGECHTPTVWTMHDCWAVTGYCPYFTMVKCERWETGCRECPQRKNYSWFVDKSTDNQSRKREAVKGLNLTVVTPSNWLAGIMRESFLGKYPIKVINNGIDHSIFRPIESDFRKRNKCMDKIILLGVAFGWGDHKGLDIFIRLDNALDDEYRMVLVGTDAEIRKTLPSDIIAIDRTNNQQELVEIYSAADIFLNPTREDNYPTVNMEAISCGTPVITFRTGGSPEMIDDTCGSVVEVDDYEGIQREVMKCGKKTLQMKENCMKKSRNFNANDKFRQYVELYEKIDKVTGEKK